MRAAFGQVALSSWRRNSQVLGCGFRRRSSRGGKDSKLEAWGSPFERVDPWLTPRLASRLKLASPPWLEQRLDLPALLGTLTAKAHTPTTAMAPSPSCTTPRRCGRLGPAFAASRHLPRFRLHQGHSRRGPPDCYPLGRLRAHGRGPPDFDPPGRLQSSRPALLLSIWALARLRAWPARFLSTWAPSCACCA